MIIILETYKWSNKQLLIRKLRKVILFNWNTIYSNMCCINLFSEITIHFSSNWFLYSNFYIVRENLLTKLYNTFSFHVVSLFDNNFKYLIFSFNINTKFEKYYPYYKSIISMVFNVKKIHCNTFFALFFTTRNRVIK